MRILLFIAALFLVPLTAQADWGACEAGGARSVGQGKALCYFFEDTDIESSTKSFDACDNVDIIYDEDGAAEGLLIYLCVTSTKTTCQTVGAAPISGGDNDNAAIGLPGTMIYLKLDGTPTDPEAPIARATCH